MIIEMKIRKNKRGLWYIGETYGSVSWYVYLFASSETYEFNKYIDYIQKEFNGNLDDKTIVNFNTKEDTEKAMEWIESIILIKTLGGVQNGI